MVNKPWFWSKDFPPTDFEDFISIMGNGAFLQDFNLEDLEKMFQETLDYFNQKFRVYTKG